MDAKEQPVPDRAEPGGEGEAVGDGAEVYVIVKRRDPVAHRALRGPGRGSNDQIAAQLDTPRQIVSKWRSWVST